MKRTFAIISASFLLAVSAPGVNAVKLEPNVTFSFEFPDLPDTLATKLTGEKQPARLTAELPDNYSRAISFLSSFSFTEATEVTASPSPFSARSQERGISSA